MDPGSIILIVIVGGGLLWLVGSGIKRRSDEESEAKKKGLRWGSQGNMGGWFPDSKRKDDPTFHFRRMGYKWSEKYGRWYKPRSKTSAPPKKPDSSLPSFNDLRKRKQ